MTQPIAEPESGLRSWLGLTAVLSAIAFVVFAVRAAQTFEIMAAVNAPVPWRTVILTQGAFWVAWSLWVLALVPLVRRVVERRPGPLASVAQMALLVAIPVVIVPALSLPVHKVVMVEGQGWPATFSHISGHNALTNLLLGAMVVTMTYGYLSVQRAGRLEMTAARLHGQLANAQLETLRAQLNPHFLFNALNSIAVLARRGRSDAVEQMVTQLAGLLRYALESARVQLLPLSEELTALSQYLAIEQVRHGSRLQVELDVPQALQRRLVPSFLLQPLAENAIRHGFIGADTVLHLTVQAEGSADRLILAVTDDGAGLERSDHSPDGVGLGNTRARLAGLYGKRAALTLSAGPEGRGVRVTVTVPIGDTSAP
jgi:two-component sensor histidine kinase